MRRLIVALGVGAAFAASIVGAGGARETAAFTCPKDAATKGTQNWVRNYQGFRGSTWCNDGAKVTVKVGAATVALSNGVCTKTKAGKYLQFGTRVSPLSKRKPADPPGVFVNDPTRVSGLEDWAEIGKGTIKWQENVKIAWTGALKGTFSGTEGQWIDNVFTQVKAQGTFTCKRLVTVNA